MATEKESEKPTATVDLTAPSTATIQPWDCDSPEHVEKYNKYIALYSRRLKAKYFSNKGFNGEDIFDHEVRVDDVVIKSSRWPCMRSFADPDLNVEDESRSPSQAAESSVNTIKKYTSKRKC